MSKNTTPGPWKAEYREVSLAVYQRTRSGAKTGRPICIVARKDIANARLIAAAPDMLTALRETLDYWDSCQFSDCAEGCDCIVQSVQAAIAKAEGRS